MSGDGLAGGEKTACFSIDSQGFSRLLLSAHEGQSCFSYPESPNVAQEPEYGHETAMFSGRTIFVLAPLHLMGDSSIPCMQAPMHSTSPKEPKSPI
jgi:hypothetical protein